MDAQVENLQPTSNGGEPLATQRRLVKKAQTRGPLMRKIRCMLGIHNPPHDKWFDEMGAVMIGGSCTACDDPLCRELVWIGNDWDFEGVATVTETEESSSYKVRLPNLIVQVERHMKYLRS